MEKMIIHHWNQVLIVVLILMLQQNVSGALFRVGSKLGWAPNVNYTQWAAQQQIYLDDWLSAYPPIL